MAGVYPDVVSKRLAWDRDGSQMFRWNGTVLTTEPLAQRQAMNDETDNTETTGLWNSGVSYGVVFPVMTTIIGYCFVSNGNGSSSTLDEYSLDSTTGIDGTWSTLRAAYTSGTAVTLPDYRTTIRTAAPLPLSVKAVRHRMPSITGSQRIRTMHYYGYRTAASNRLELWHPTLDQPLYLTPALGDFGDVPRATGYKIFSFRVKNLSATLTAQTITVVREMMTDGSPTILSLTDLQYNAGGYGTTTTVPNLGPGAISAGIVDARVNVTNLAPIGPWTERFVAAAATWV